MRIEFDYDVDADGRIQSVHFIDTDDPLVKKVVGNLLSGVQDVKGTGWDELSKHPSYDDKTRLHVVGEEIKRLRAKL